MPAAFVVVWAVICTVRLVEGHHRRGEPGGTDVANREAEAAAAAAGAGQGEHQRRPGVNRHRGGWKPLQARRKGRAYVPRQEVPRLQRLGSRLAGSPSL